MSNLGNLMRKVASSVMGRRRPRTTNQKRHARPEPASAPTEGGQSADEVWQRCIEDNLFGANTDDYTIRPMRGKNGKH